METVNFIFHYKGVWMTSPHLSYIGGESLKVERVDVDFISFTHMVKKYKEEFEMPLVHNLLYDKCGEMILIENDVGIRVMTEYIRTLNIDDVIHIYPVEPKQVGTQCSSYRGREEDVHNVVPGGWVTSVENDMYMSQVMEELIDAGISEEWQDMSRGLRVDGLHADIVGEGYDVHVDKWGYGDDVEVDSIEGEQMFSDSEDASYLEFSEPESESNAFSSEEEETTTTLMNHSKYGLNDKSPHFMLGMTFLNAAEARIVITRYSIAKCTPLKLRPNEKTRIRARCKTEGCPFHLFISKYDDTSALKVKTIESEHTCLRDSENKLATVKFLASEFKETIYNKPKTSVKDLVVDAQKNLKLFVSVEKAKRAKRLIINELDGSFKAQFAYLGAYVDAITRNEPGTTAKLEVCEKSLKEGRFVFKRLYICFDALKKGWKAGCRPIIGLDGCHLKGAIRGQLLVAVGKDGNEQLFPIAWAVIGIENKENWTWFLQLLVKDLEIHEDGKYITIISDMQKGLVQSVKDVMPFAEHRYCARHVYANWSKKWHGKELRKWFWACSWSTYKEELDDNLKKLGDLSKSAAEDFVAYNPGTFCRAFISSRCKSAMVDNNMCESFNSCILDARHKPIVSMLDDIRQAAMNRMASNKADITKWTNKWSPSCMQTYQEQLEAAFGCSVIFNGATGYEVGDGDDRHTLFIDRRLCSCRAWDLTGIPCSHAICAIKHAKKDPKTFISDWFHKSKYMECYEHVIQPLGGKQFYNCDRFEKLEPPPNIKLPGRPKKVRIRGAHESMKGKTSGKLPRKMPSRKDIKLRCSICKSEKHNRNRCPKKSTFQEVGHTMASRKSRRTSGLGIYTNEETGNMILNPGFPSETLIRQQDAIASQPLSSISSPGTRFAIPNEREMRKAKQGESSSTFRGKRKIVFNIGNNGESITPTNLPFKPPGLKWKGKSSVTTHQLQLERDKKMARKVGSNV